MRRNSIRTRRLGVTLTEIMVVIAIITSLSTLSFVSFSAAKRFGDRLQSDAAQAIARTNPNAKNPSPHSETSTAQEPIVPAQPRPVYVPGSYYVGFASTVQNPAAEAQRLATVVGGEVKHVYTGRMFGCAIYCSDENAGLLGIDSAVARVRQAKYVYAAQVPQNIQRIHSNGIRGTGAAGFRVNSATATPVRWDKTGAGTMYGLPTSIYQYGPVSGASARPAVPITGRVLIPGSSVAATSTIAILDSGIDAGHPDLNVVSAVDFTGGNNPLDTYGHGTHVAGVVAAANRTGAGGVVGVYPGASLINLKVMGSTQSNAATNIRQITVANGQSSSPGPGLTNYNNALLVETDPSGQAPNSGTLVTLSAITMGTITAPNPSAGTFTVRRRFTGGMSGSSSTFFFLESTNGAGMPVGGATALPVPPYPGTFTRIGVVPTDITNGSSLDVIAALDNYVIPNARSINVALMAFETTGVDDVLNEAVDAAANAGVLIVAAAGNQNSNARTDTSPASASQAIVVGALIDSNGTPNGGAPDDTRTYSNFNCDFYAPGGDQVGSVTNFYRIRSTIPVARLGMAGRPATPYSDFVDGDTLNAQKRAFGTSYAAAHVAGMMALMLDPQAQIGWTVNGRGPSTYRLQMTNRASAIAALTNLTRRTESVQVINPFTNSMWVRSTSVGPFFNLTTVTPFTIDMLPNDEIAEPGGRRVPVANFYVNPGDARSPGGGLAVFPGHSQ